jgi:hypothetical protein
MESQRAVFGGDHGLRGSTRPSRSTARTKAVPPGKQQLAIEPLSIFGEEVLGFRLIQSQDAIAVASATPGRKLAVELVVEGFHGGSF